MKNTNKIVLVLMALVCLVLAGCPQPEQPETWEEIKTLKGLDGTWVTTVDSGDDGEDLAKEFSSIATVYSANAFITIKGDKIQQYNSISIDMTAEIEKGLETAPAGVEADVLWEALKNYWITASKAYEDMEFSFSSGRPYLIIITEKPYEISEESIFNGKVISVNNKKNRIKMVSSETEEMIYVKK